MAVLARLVNWKGFAGLDLWMTDIIKCCQEHLEYKLALRLSYTLLESEATAILETNHWDGNSNSILLILNFKQTHYCLFNWNIQNNTHDKFVNIFQGFIANQSWFITYTQKIVWWGRGRIVHIITMLITVLKWWFTLQIRL